MTCENVLPLLTGGQVVAASNPVSPTRELAVQWRFWRIRSRLGICDPLYVNAYANQNSLRQRSQPEPTCQPVHRGPRRVVGCVAVYVAGDCNRGMPEQIGDRLDMHTGLKQIDGRAVPQGVDAEGLDTCG